MGFTHHNRNLSFKQSGERSGFPGKTYRPQNTAFGGKLSSATEEYHDCISLFVVWVAPSGIKPTITALLFKLRTVYILY